MEEKLAARFPGVTFVQADDFDGNDAAPVAEQVGEAQSRRALSVRYPDFAKKG